MNIFTVTGAAFYLRNIKHVTFVGAQTNPIFDSVEIRVNGGGTTDSNSEDIHFVGLRCYSDVNLVSCQNVVIDGFVSGTLMARATALRGTFTGVAGATSVASPSFKLYTPAGVLP